MAGLPEWLAAGRVGRPHGLDGSFHVTRPRPGLLRVGLPVRVAATAAAVVERDDAAATAVVERDDAAAPAAVGRDDAAAVAVVERCDGTEAQPIVRLDCARSRTAVEGLRGADLLVARADAPALDEDEFYAEQLEGLSVRDGAVEVGVVERMLELPSCEVLAVRRGDGGELLVPMVRDAVRAIDVERGVVEVDLAFVEGEPPA